MTKYTREAAFLTPSLIVFYVYIFILTVVVTFLAPLYTTKSFNEVSNVTEPYERVLKKVKGFLTKIEEETCFTTQLKDDCKDHQKNVTNLDYPTTIIIVQISVCCPFVLVTVLCVYWEVRRCRNLSAKIVTVVIICIKFESIHVLGYVYFPVFIGKEMGFSWGDLEFVYFIGIGNIAFVWIWLVAKIYTTKKTHLKRKYKTRLKKSDPVYIADKFIFVEYSTKKRTHIMQTCTVDIPMTNLNVKQHENLKPENAQRSATEEVTSGSGSEGVIDINQQNAESINRIQSVNDQRNALELPLRIDCASADIRTSSTHSVVEITEYAGTGRQTELGQRSVATTENQAAREEFLQTLDVNSNEYVCIKALIEKLWSPELIGIGRDARVHNFSRIRVKTIKQIKNDTVWNQYSNRKADIKHFATDYCDGKLFSPEEYGSDINAIKTKQAISRLPENVLGIKTDKNINEHFLFHGTDICNIPSIAQKGFEKSKSHRKMLGKGVYFTDHPVKADQYTGLRNVGETHIAYCMILARVLLGNPVITKVRNVDLTSAERPPCKICLSVSCSHGNNFDSLIFDGGLFREYVVFENNLAYPEYVIYYDRVSS